tara:strand:- start:11415 stop:12389 length:975 start_codon:yes stop_codon:yes gene_type:complete
LPSSQTPRVDIADKSLKIDNMNDLLGDVDKRLNATAVSDQKKSLSSGTPSGRRKTIDRRDDVKDKLVDDDRRANSRRQKAPVMKSAAEKKEEQDELKLQQHRKKILLAGCEPVMGFNYDYLAMDDYPENSLVSAARRDRDYWLTICSIFGAVFLFGLFGFVPPGIAGMSCGFGVLSAFFAFSPARQFFFKRPHLYKLLQKRKEIEFRALNHISLLEGKDGLAWRCAKLKKYNSNLTKKIFSGLFHYSKRRQLLSVVRQKKHIRLYLLLMIESQKAYKRLEKDYLENHFKNMENGVNDRIDAEEANKLEQMLNMSNEKEQKPKQS